MNNLTVEVRFGEKIKTVPAYIHKYTIPSENLRSYRDMSRVTPKEQQGIRFEHDSSGRWFGYIIE